MSLLMSFRALTQVNKYDLILNISTTVNVEIKMNQDQIKAVEVVFIVK